MLRKGGAITGDAEGKEELEEAKLEAAGSGSAAAPAYASSPTTIFSRPWKTCTRGSGRFSISKGAARVSSEETRPWRANPHAHKARNTPKERERERERERRRREKSESPSLPYSTYFPVL